MGKAHRKGLSGAPRWLSEGVGCGVSCAVFFSWVFPLSFSFLLRREARSPAFCGRSSPESPDSASRPVSSPRFTKQYGRITLGKSLLRAFLLVRAGCTTSGVWVVSTRTPQKRSAAPTLGRALQHTRDDRFTTFAAKEARLPPLPGFFSPQGPAPHTLRAAVAVRA